MATFALFLLTALVLSAHAAFPGGRLQQTPGNQQVSGEQRSVVSGEQGSAVMIKRVSGEQKSVELSGEQKLTVVSGNQRSTVLSGEQRSAADLTETCLGCICEATSNCTMNIGCTRGFCGPFFISHKYWTQAGMPLLAGDDVRRAGAYHDCVTDPYCAARTVRGYMDRYVQDCNRDRRISCEDFGRIHYMGGNQCGLSMKQYTYYKVFKQCLASVEQLSG